MEGHHPEGADALERYLAGEASDVHPGVVDPQWAAARDVLHRDIPKAEMWDVGEMFARVLDQVRGASTEHVETLGADSPGRGRLHRRSKGVRTFRDAGIADLGKQTLQRRAVMDRWSVKSVVRNEGWLASVVLGVLLIMLVARPHVSRNQGITRTYATDIGKQAMVVLDDGTRVMLASGTTLHLDRFGERSRTVTLDGVAFFDVTRRTGAPFTVHSGGATIQVLGTSFLVRHTAGNANAHVSVAIGKVLVVPRSQPSAAVTLVAGEFGDATDSLVRSASLEAPPTPEWIRGQLAFRDRPVEEILQTLTRWYGYRFHCADPQLSQHVVTMLVSMRSSTDALAALEQVLNVSLTIVGDTVTLTPRSVRQVRGTPRVRAYDVWIPTAEVGR